MKTTISLFVLSLALVFAGAADARGHHDDNDRHGRSSKELKHSKKDWKNGKQDERRHVHGGSRDHRQYHGDKRHDRRHKSDYQDSHHHRAYKKTWQHHHRAYKKSWQHHAGHRHHKKCGHGNSWNLYVGHQQSRPSSWYQWGHGGQCFKVKDNGYKTVWIEVPLYRCR